MISGKTLQMMIWKSWMHPFPLHFLSQAYQLRWSGYYKEACVPAIKYWTWALYQAQFTKSHSEGNRTSRGTSKWFIAGHQIGNQRKVILFQKTALVDHQQEKKNMFIGWNSQCWQTLQHHCLVYWQARYAMLRLGVNQEKLDTDYWKLHDDDLQTSTAVVEPNVQEQWKKELFWLWQKIGMNISNQTTVVNKCEFPNIQHCSMTTHSIILQYIKWIEFEQDHIGIDGEKRSQSSVMICCGLFYSSRPRLIIGYKGLKMSNCQLVWFYMPISKAAMWDRLKKLGIILFNKVHPDLLTVFGYRMIKQEVLGNEKNN